MATPGKTSFLEAVLSRLVKRAMPTEKKSAEIAAIKPQILERSVFSARVANIDILDGINQQVTKMVSGLRTGAGDYSNPATVHAALLDLVQKSGYQPEPDKAGTIEDLSSNRRIDLIIQMNADDARGYGQWQQGQDPDVVDEWPCQELYRLESRHEPRDWGTTANGRWIRAAREVGDTAAIQCWSNHNGRMVARKDSPIWEKLSRFGKPYPPFDFNSGMWTRQIDREESIALGVIKPDDKVQPQSRGFNEEEAA